MMAAWSVQVSERLKELGFADLTKEQLHDAFTAFKDVADQKKEVRLYDACVWNESAILDHARLRFTYIFDARIACCCCCCCCLCSFMMRLTCMC